MPLIKCKDGNNSYTHHNCKQFTGLKDKNGKGIFEGDRIITRWVDVISGKIAEREITIKSIFDYELMAAIIKADEIEVIGNIHENKDLLK